MNTAPIQMVPVSHTGTLRILVATNVYPPRFVGGAELMAHKLALALAQQGHEVRVFAGDLGGPIPHGDRLDDMMDGMVIHRIGMAPRDFDPAWQNLVHGKVDRHLAAVLTEFQPDVVHAHNLMGLSVRLPTIASELGIPTVVTLHDYWGICLRNTLMRPDGRQCEDTTQCRMCLPVSTEAGIPNLPMRLRKDSIALSLASVAAFVSPSRFLADRYVAWGLPADRMNVIANGMDPFPCITPDREADTTVRILYVGYLGAHKGVAGLIDAVAAMKRRTQVRLKLVGVGPEKDALHAQALRAGLDQLEFAGRIAPDQMSQVYANADIMVLPSVWSENQPVSIMEAMSSGLAVVASQIGGIPELIEDGVTGRLCEPGNVAMLAQLLDELVDHPDDRQSLARNAKVRMENRGFPAQAAMIEALFRQVIAAKLLPSPAKPVVGIVGSCAGRIEDPDRADLPEELLKASLLAPAEWLTAGQRQQCVRLRSYRTFGILQRAWSGLQALSFDLLLRVLPGRARPRVIVRALRSRPNFPPPG
ncbi:MAG: hypothetical protein B7X90_01255 [Novosphingobium sp. 17-62-19]|uniref:glycosyltransferase family 4 protein n=1 Tax=Novosphingobium sp. 17-62-19 TaxID=1970406 RepID=UPI000BD43AF9|nr:glycosyltransferase family 4 protein [Novosphingobium sp. 17-62-19]OZA21535.1 MAG: hypothetical protein B7X90_01255 [Novosphingobium sp. 17-62-19]HQS95137.1 glycosyltransferase family 4 protein [Novosphingobium sp.]